MCSSAAAYGVTEHDRNHAYLKSKMHKVGGAGSERRKPDVRFYTRLVRFVKTQTNAQPAGLYFHCISYGQKTVSAHKLHSYSPCVNVVFQHSYDGLNFTFISLEGKDLLKN